MLSMGVGGPPPRSTPAALANAAGEDGDSSMQMGPPAGNGEDDSLESLPPLERARRRKSMLPSR
ncbi:hypothetical protein C8T65DRAFT_681065 [Cerioporus squamosus]|nr:hypothetical protein C8T65DRAFT_681065 [Cerioporus squamosus]